MNLTERQYHLLGIIYDNWEPFEQLFIDMLRLDGGLQPSELCSAVYELYEKKYLTIIQAPITTQGQTFARRIVEPTSPAEIFGDLEEEYYIFYQERDYHRRVSQFNIGVPFGIWLQITEEGREVWAPGRANC